MKIAIDNCEHCRSHVDVVVHGKNELCAAELVQPIMQQINVHIVGNIRRQMIERVVAVRCLVFFFFFSQARTHNRGIV